MREIVSCVLGTRPGLKSRHGCLRRCGLWVSVCVCLSVCVFCAFCASKDEESCVTMLECCAPVGCALAGLSEGARCGQRS